MRRSHPPRRFVQSASWTDDVSDTASCARCRRTFGNSIGLEKHLRDSGNHLDHPGNQHHLLLAKIQEGLHARKASLTSSTRHVSDTVFAVAGSSSGTIEGGSNQNSLDKTSSVVQAGSTSNKSKYKHKKAKKSQKASRDGGPVAIVSDRGHDDEIVGQITGEKANEDNPTNTTAHPNQLDTMQHVAPQAAFSEDESAYFTSDEVNMSAEASVRGVHSPNEKVFTTPDDAPLEPSVTATFKSMNISSSPPTLSSDAAVPANVGSDPAPRAESRASSSVHSSTSFNWHVVLQSSIPRDTFEMSDDGAVHCIPCAKGFVTFREFQTHYATAEEHTGRAPPPVVKSLVSLPPDGPPPLERVADDQTLPPLERGSPPPQSHSNPLQARQLKNRSHHYGMSSHTCVPCNLDYTNDTALQRHKASATRKHPYYCQYCAHEYDNFENLQMHYQYSRQCRLGQPSTGAESTRFNYQDYRVGRVGQRPTDFRLATTTSRNVSRNVTAPTVKEDSTSTDNAPSCPICMTSLTDVSDATATFCGHVFCAPCILEHLRTRNNCPRCRKLISPMMLIPLFF
ncbi:hypothetical protein P389DRAFT_54573 [Cystobasidium minutum MCA 4210]|uniref:uncharacterized protein n=1 Tax=Cystobasidium minutum MCA 4210 TaxID=1397322 RepID=UPI0034CEA28E|eukprot:jgi/Rhomi1/54573/CE54572_227